jgi:hypothetical protein
MIENLTLQIARQVLVITLENLIAYNWDMVPENVTVVVESIMSSKIVLLKAKVMKGKKSAACNVIQEHAFDNFENENVEMTVEMPNGQVIPYIATVNAKEVNDKMLPNLSKPHKGQGFANNHKIRFVRDTGSNLTIVTERFIKPDQLTGKPLLVCLQMDVLNHILWLKLKSAHLIMKLLYWLQVFPPLCMIF